MTLNTKSELTDQLPVIDFEYGAKIIESDIEAAKEMLRELIAVLPGDLEKLKAIFASGDLKKLKDAAHYIKGGACYCGTPRLKIAATELEACARTSADPVLIKTAYETLCREIEAICQLKIE